MALSEAFVRIELRVIIFLDLPAPPRQIQYRLELPDAQGLRDQNADHDFHSWDDWVPQERVRKFTDENKELASNLRKDLNAQQRATNGKASSSTKKRPFGSDLTTSPARGSEDRSSAVPPPPPRGTKRGRDIEGIDKVCISVLSHHT